MSIAYGGRLTTYPLPLPLQGKGGASKRGASPLSKISSLSPLAKERGTKGERLINNLYGGNLNSGAVLKYSTGSNVEKTRRGVTQP